MLKALTCALCLAAAPVAASGLKITVAGEANGVIEIDLLEDVAPKHVAQLTTLASEGFYNGVYFHRVMDGFMAQTGDGQFAKAEGGNMRRAGTGGSALSDVEAEFSDVPFDRGVVGIARSGDPACAGVRNCQEAAQYLNSGNSQFFIMFDEGHFLNGKYTVVGRVTSGLDVLDAIKRGHSRTGAITGTPDIMTTVEVTD